MDINGVWKGEYITLKHIIATNKEIPVPFVLKIKTTDDGKLISLDKGLFEGICQDDPEITKIPFHGTVYGSLNVNNIFFIKQYPKLMIRNDVGGIETVDDTHPEVYYKGEFKNNRFSGSWNMNRTFRKINGQLSELMPLHGVWWMEKI